MAGIVLLVLLSILGVAAIVVLAVIVVAWKALAALLIEFLASIRIFGHQPFFDIVPESYATAYQSGGGGRAGGGAFSSLAISYKGHGVIRAPGNLDWGVRKLGDADTWSGLTDQEGKVYTPGQHTYEAEDFRWDRRPWIVKKVFGDNTGIVWMGPWPRVDPKYYELRINNFRTVAPTKEEVEKKRATVREYKIGNPNDKGERQTAGFLVSWNERTKNVPLYDDIYPIPIDGVRIGTNITTQKDDEAKKPQGVTADILLFVPARITEPYLYLYRGEDVLELVQNQLISIVRELCAGMSIEELFALKVTLESDKAGQENPILSQNGCGKYFHERYGFQAKGASFGIIDIAGKAGDALIAPYIAEQEAKATAIRGRGEGEAESNRLKLEGKAFDEVIATMGPEVALALRNADVAESIGARDKSNTLFFGLDLKNLINGIGGALKPAPLPEPKGKELESASKK